MNNILSELRRRNVFRVAAAYLVVGWLLIQLAALLENSLGLPGWFDAAVIGFLVIGLPIALLLAWAFEMTPEGVKKTEAVADPSGYKPLGSSDYVLIAGVVVVLGVVGFQNFGPKSEPPIIASFEAVEADTQTPNPSDTPATEPVDEISADVANAPPALSVAVLPFVAMSSDPEDRYFADGLTEEILNYLAAVPELLVTSRTSAFQFRGENLPPVPEIARQLGVAHIVEGSIRRSGDRVRVTAQIIRAADDSHLWSQTYDRTMDDIFAIQDDIAENVTNVLDIVLDEDQRARMGEIGVSNVEAYIAYQRGIEISLDAHQFGTDTLPDLVPAEALFAEATRLAPGFSDAYMQQADYYAHLMNRSAHDDTDEGRATLERASDRYFELLDLARDTTTDPDRRAMIGIDRVYMRDNWTGARAAIVGASQTTGCPYAAWVRELVALSGQAESFLPYAQRIVQCDPLNVSNWKVLADIAYYAGQFDLAYEASLSGLRLDPTDISMVVDAADALFQAGREDEIIQRMDFFQVPDPFRGYYGAMFAARAGDREAAIESRLLMGEPDDDGFDEGELMLHAVLGERDAANAMVARRDDVPGFHLTLINITARCRCGALWDLEFTPNFARRMEEADFPWPPPGADDYPLKDW